VSRALRVRLRVVAAVGRAETHPAFQRGSDSRRAFFARSPNARPRDKGVTAKPAWNEFGRPIWIKRNFNGFSLKNFL